MCICAYIATIGMLSTKHVLVSVSLYVKSVIIMSSVYGYNAASVMVALNASCLS